MDKKLCILIASNNPELLDNASVTLREAGYKICLSNTVEACLKMAAKEKPDILLLDVSLEKEGGKELTQKIRGCANRPDMISILSSPDADAKLSANEKKKDWVDNYLTEPLNRIELLAKMDAAGWIIQNKRELASALTKSRSLFVAMQEGVYLHEMVYDEKGKAIDYRILEANPASEKHLNIKTEDAIGKLASVLYETQEVPFLETYAKVAETGVATSFEQYFPPMGKYFHISVYSPEKGTFATAFTDISQRKLVEKALQDSEEKYKKLVKDMQVGVILQDSRAAIIMSNPKALELLGLSEDQLLGKTSFDPDWNVIHEDGSPFPGSTHPVPQAIASGQAVHDVVMGVYRPTHNDRIWLRVDAELQHDNNGELVQVVCTFVDISRRVKAEDALIVKNEELAKAISEKDQFFSIIAHDLRGPFNGFLGLSQILVNEISSLTTEEIQNISVKIRDSASSISSLLGNLLQWASIQRGSTIFSPESFVLKTFLNESLVPVLMAAEAKEIEFKIDIPDNLAIHADVNIISCIIRNLTSNAVKFTHKNGSVTLAAKYSSADTVEFNIIDTGIGMNKDLVRDLFKLNANTSRKGTNGEASTGLGLIICRDFVEMHGGRIWVESEEKKGSTIGFTIPSKGMGSDRQAEEKAIRNGLGLEQGKKLKVLIVEDDNISCTILKKNIQKICREILLAGTGTEAVQLCRGHQDIDLVLMDLRLPVLMGLDATREIRQFNKDVIILAQTAQALPEDKKLALDAGCNDYISKPIDFKLLERLIKYHCNI